MSRVASTETPFAKDARQDTIPDLFVPADPPFFIARSKRLEMAASPIEEDRVVSASPSVRGEQDDRADAASPVSPVASAADDDDLFGDDASVAGDADDQQNVPSRDSQNAEEEEEDEDDVRPSNRRRKRAVDSGSPAPEELQQGRPGTSTLPTFDDDDEDGAADRREVSEDAEEAARIAALEYPEDENAMGRLNGRSPSPMAARVVANIALANTVQRFTPHHLARLPLFLKMEHKAFEESQYISDRQAAVEEEAQADERTRDVERRLRCENTIRWKIDQDQTYRSNSRFVRWSDGSWTLQVGKEHFDIAGLDTNHAGSKDIQTADAGAGSNDSVIRNGNVLSQTQSQEQSSASQGVVFGGSGASKNANANGHKKAQTQPLTYLATQDAETDLFQTLGPLHSNISIQPASLQSATHRLISKNLPSVRSQQGASKVTMSELVAGEKAPEEVKRERERKLLEEERKKRLRKKKEAGGDIEAEEEAELLGLLKGRRKTMIEEASRGSRSKGPGGSRRGGLGGVSTALDEDEEEDTGGYMEDDADGFIVNDEDDDAEGEEDDEEEDDDDDDDEDGSDAGDKARQKAKTAKKKSSSAAASRSDAMEVDEELDDMEKAEIEIERQEAARARAKKEAAATTAPSGDGQSQRRKKAIADSDDDDDDE
ncbi:unnamed protein product [Parajaminaea phylloscopi]